MALCALLFSLPAGARDGASLTPWVRGSGPLEGREELAFRIWEPGDDVAGPTRGTNEYLLAYEVGQRLAHEGYAVITGGGPGVMEAGNRGAHEVGGKSLGLNIVLPHEQEPNPYITPKLCFQFHYFALRKMHFLMRSVALVCFPGGFGTLDELFETLTLIQTGKCRKRPVLLFGRAFWTKLINFDHLVETGMISPEDVHLFRYVETADEAWDTLREVYRLGQPEADTACGW